MSATKYRPRTYALPDKAVAELNKLDADRAAAIEQTTRQITGQVAIQKYQLVRGVAAAMNIDLDGEWDFTVSDDNRRLIGKRKPKPKQPRPGEVNPGDTGVSNVVPLKGRKRKAS